LGSRARASCLVLARLGALRLRRPMAAASSGTGAAGALRRGLGEFASHRAAGVPLWSFFSLMVVLSALGHHLDQPDGGASAFFIDNKTRRMVHTTVFDHIRYWLKVVLLVVSVYIEYGILFRPLEALKQKKDVSRSTFAVREWICLFCGAAFVARVVLQMVFWSRIISWVEVFAEAGIIIPLSLASLGFGAARKRAAAIGAMEVIGVILFLVGTYLIVWPEYTRHLWKRDPANAGRLYVGGLFGVCRHINYFGETLSFVGFAMATSAWWNVWIPMVMGAGLILFSVPELDAYLSSKYAADWVAYTQDVQCQMIPFVW